MNTAYKTEERVIRNLILTHVRCTNEDKKLNLVIYYNTRKTANLVMVNNMPKNKARQKSNGHLQQANVIYQFTCPEEGCRLLNKDKYIGATTTTYCIYVIRHIHIVLWLF